MDADYIGAYIAGGALFFAVIQGVVSWRAAARQRDSDLTLWGGDVIDLMAELETACHPLVSEDQLDRVAVERLSHRASALVDKGRLFFPNVRRKGQGPKDEGTRVKLLDEVLKACYVARHLARYGRPQDRKKLRDQIWTSRRNFINQLQNEMSSSLKRVKEDSAGDRILLDPGNWDNPDHEARLPGEEPQHTREA